VPAPKPVVREARPVPLAAEDVTRPVQRPPAVICLPPLPPLDEAGAEAL
jgi:hypothetical protein